MIPRRYSQDILNNKKQNITFKPTSLSSNINLCPYLIMNDDNRDNGNHGDGVELRFDSKFEFNSKSVDNRSRLPEDLLDDEKLNLNFEELLYPDAEQLSANKRWFAFVINDCPPSLKLLVRFYR